MKLNEIFENATGRKYPKGQIVLYQGEKAQQTYYIRSGFVKVYDVTAEGNEKLVMILGPNDLFPLIWSVSGKYALKYFYETFEDAELCVMDRDDFVEAVETDHEVTKRVLRYFVTITRELMLRIEGMEASSALHKVAHVLQYLALAHGDKITNDTYKIGMNITQQSIANMAGITRETTSIQMTELEKLKIVTSPGEYMLVHTDRIEKLQESN